MTPDYVGSPVDGDLLRLDVDGDLGLRARVVVVELVLDAVVVGFELPARQSALPCSEARLRASSKGNGSVRSMACSESSVVSCSVLAIFPD